MRQLVYWFLVLSCTTTYAAEHRRPPPFPNLADHLTLPFVGDWLTAKSPVSYYAMLKSGDDPSLIRGSQILVNDFLTKGIFHLKWRAGSQQRSQRLHELAHREMPKDPTQEEAVAFLSEMISSIVITLKETYPESWGRESDGTQRVTEPDGLLQRGRLLSLVVLAKVEKYLAGGAVGPPSDRGLKILASDLDYLWGNRRVLLDRECSTYHRMMALPQAACSVAFGSLIASLPYPKGVTETVSEQLRRVGSQIPGELEAAMAMLPKQLTDAGEVIGAATDAARGFVSTTLAEGTGNRLRQCGSLSAREGLRELLPGFGEDDWELVQAEEESADS